MGIRAQTSGWLLIYDLGHMLYYLKYSHKASACTNIAGLAAI